jgi:Na+-driven multidrug efflux pump
LVLAFFNYLQSGLSMVIGLWITRFFILDLGEHVYGKWTASAALLNYATLADLGMLAVLPWLVAEADGRRDEAGLAKLLKHGVAVAAMAGALFLAAAAVLWLAYPWVLHLSDEDKALLRGPLTLLAVAIAVGYPLRAFSAFLNGVQDVLFLGVLGTVQVIGGALLMVVLASHGYGLYALAAGVALPPLCSSAISCIRALWKRPELRKWAGRLEWPTLKPMLTGGSGSLLGSLGWQLAFASDAVVIGYLGSAREVTVFAVTSRLGLILMQLGWTLPDSANVGLAQLKAEAAARVPGVVLSILRTHLLVAGAVACAVLALNPGFVNRWVGAELFGGWALNSALALAILALSSAHALLVAVAVLGKRFIAGLFTTINGLLHIGLALLWGRGLGLTGVALATTASAFVSTIPLGFHLLPATTGLARLEVWKKAVFPWAIRFVPMGVLCGLMGYTCQGIGLPLLFLLGLAVGLGYFALMRQLILELPLRPTMLGILRKISLHRTSS